MPLKLILVRADWDDDAGVWVASSGDVPGLVTEAETLEILTAKVKVMIPELLEANGIICDSPEIPVVITSSQSTRVLAPKVAA